MSWQGEIIPLNKKNLGATAQVIRDKLGEPDKAPSVQAVKARIAVENYGSHKRLRKALAQKQQTERQPLTLQKRRMVKAHREAREVLKYRLEQRELAENKERLNRLRKGWRGLWDLVTGKSKNIRAINEAEATACQSRDQQEREARVREQLDERQSLQKKLNLLREKHHSETIALNARFVKHGENLEHQGELKAEFERIAQYTKSHQHTLEPRL